jgi:hypothetical protein
MSNPVPRKGMMKWLLSADENRPRAGWRLLTQQLIMLAFTILLLFIIVLVLQFIGQESLTNNLILSQAVFLIAVTLSIYVARGWIDRRSWVSLGLKWDEAARQDLVFGTLIAGALMAFIFVVELATGWLAWAGFAWESVPAAELLRAVLSALIAFVAVAWTEELLTRGYLLQNIAEGTNLKVGVLLSSLYFAVLHASNPNVSWIAIVGLLVSGLFLAYSYVRTRTLWLAMGLHFGWNFFQNTVFGFPVSGLDAPGLMVHEAVGPELITGGAFGPEAGLILLPALGLGAALVYWYTQGRPQPEH